MRKVSRFILCKVMRYLVGIELDKEGHFYLLHWQTYYMHPVGSEGTSASLSIKRPHPKLGVRRQSPSVSLSNTFCTIAIPLAARNLGDWHWHRWAPALKRRPAFSVYLVPEKSNSKFAQYTGVRPHNRHNYFKSDSREGIFVALERPKTETV